MIPHRIPFFLPLLYPSLIWRIPDPHRTLYLTFDDGPVPGPTEFVIDTLEKMSASATFFCIGDNIRKHPHIFSRIIANGYAVGNHTVNHLNGWKTPAEAYVENVRAFDTIASAYGSPPVKLFRPPYGRITRRQIRALAGYRIVMWNVLAQDYDKGLSPEKCLERTIRAVTPGSIIVFHDSYKSERNMRYALPRLMEHFAGQGFTFESLKNIQPPGQQ